jgi:nitroreductase
LLEQDCATLPYRHRERSVTDSPREELWMQVDEIVLDVMGTARSMRWLTDEPVDPALVERVVWAGTRASSPGNSQAWDFLVVTSSEIKQRVQHAIVERWPLGGGGADELNASHLPTDPTDRRTMLGAQNMVATMHMAPVLIFVCGANIYPRGAPRIEWAYSAVYSAAQNMLVAARALGLGAAFTTFHYVAEAEVREILRIPDDRILGITMPLGWPARPFGPVTRRPISEVIHYEGW